MPDVVAAAPAPVAPKNGATPTTPQPPVAPAPSKDVAVKADPLTDREKMVAQKDAAASKAFREAADMRKQAQALIEDFKRDPVGTVTKAGADGKAVLREYIEREDARAKMTPEQQEIDRLKREAQDKDARLKEVDDKATQAKQDELTKHTETWLEHNFLEAAKRHNLPGTPEMLEMMADVGIEIGEYGITPATAGYADMVAREALHRINEHQNSIREKTVARAVKAGDAKALKELLGAEGVALLLKDSVAGIPSAGAVRPSGAEPVKREAKGHVTPAEFDKAYGFSAKRKA